MKLAILVLNYNTKYLLNDCLTSLFKILNPDADAKVILIDNASKDGSVEMVKKKFPEVKIIENQQNLGYSSGNNVGLKKVKADFYLLLNSDTLVLKDSLINLVNFAKNSDFGIISCKLIFKNGEFQPNAGDFPFGFALFNWISGMDGLLESLGINVPSFHINNVGYYEKSKKVGWVSGTAMLIKSETISRIGYLDEDIFMYGEDVEYCYRALRNGINTGWTNSATIVHIQGGSSKDANFKQWLGEFKGILYIYKKYFDILSLMMISLLIKFFIILRIFFYFLAGKLNISKTYAKVFINI